ncbi:hypothetical protein [Loktanella salsilacus]|uniref:hypothetical protein n=1 Tax=Loktanella salsilacus TaxID=195913 RepID=UPI0035613956
MKDVLALGCLLIDPAHAWLNCRHGTEHVRKPTQDDSAGQITVAHHLAPIRTE